MADRMSGVCCVRFILIYSILLIRRPRQGTRWIELPLEGKRKAAAAKTLETDADEIRPQYVLDAPDANALFASDIVRGNGASIASTINQLENAAITDLNSEWRLALPSYSDQVLPFNVTLAGANEYGAMCASFRRSSASRS